MSEKLDTEVKRRERRAADVDGWDRVAVITVGSEMGCGRTGSQECRGAGLGRAVR